MASADPLVFDMSQMSEATPSVFTKRDMLALQDQQNGNYASNQIVIDTSQLANSNKYMAYRDAYLSVPMILAATSLPVADASSSSALPAPATAGTSADFGFGLKNWFGSIVHSMILDYSGTTIIQQTPLSGLWNCFVLHTTLSLGDLETIGASIGFYPDDVNFVFRTSENEGLIKGVTNTFNSVAQGGLVNNHAGGHQFSNKGMFERQNKMLTSEGATTGSGLGSAVSTMMDSTTMGQLYTSQVIARVNPIDGNASTIRAGCVVYAIQAQIYLKHLHSFFSQIPLLKGVFFRLTLNINNVVMNLKQGDAAGKAWDLSQSSITCPLGGVNPILMASSATAAATKGPITSLIDNAAGAIRSNTFSSAIIPGQATQQTELRVTLSVGNKVIDSVQKSRLDAVAGSPSSSKLNQSCILNVPAYTFNPSFEEAYLSQPVKTIMYSDIFQYTTPSVTESQFNFLITNGISNIKSVLVLPLLSSLEGSTPSAGTGAASLPPFQSPYDTCGSGTTAPYAALNNFNVVVAGQNMVYNQVQYDYQQFEDQLRGVNSVNGGLVDGLTSGLIDFHKFQRMYRYYYVNCARMLPIDEAVPKSISISGTSLSKLPITFYVFIEYGVQVSVDCLTGARV